VRHRPGAAGVDDHVPVLRQPVDRIHAERGMPMGLRLSCVPRGHPTAPGRLLRVLFLRHGEVPTDPAQRRVLRLMHRS
jgi:hypothetical protein